MLGLVLLFLNLGTPEVILIMFVALLLFGGEKLPGLAKGLGKGIRDFKDASEGVKREINNQINSYEDKKSTTEIARSEEEPVNDLYHEAEAETEAEQRPLINTSPVAGTTPLGGSPAVTATEEHTTHTDAHKPAEPVKTTHE